MPRISVIVPAYNAQANIEKCINSILLQSFKDFELIIINDGSSDNTGAICDAFAAADERVKVIHQKNGGVSLARNVGIREAGGELLAFVDADDYILPNAYELMLNAMQAENAKTAMCNFQAESPDGTLSEYGKRIAGGFYTEDEAEKLIVRALLSERLQAGFNGFIWCYLFDKKTIADNGLSFNGAYLEDELFLIEYFSIGSNLAVCDEALYRYRLEPTSVTRNYLKNYTETFKTSFEIKKQLVDKYRPELSEDWKESTLWAGLLIAVGNEFAPGNSAGFAEKLKNLRAMCEKGVFSDAVKTYVPTGMGRNKSIVALLIRKKLYFLLALMYAVKNRNRS